MSYNKFSDGPVTDYPRNPRKREFPKFQQQWRFDNKPAKRAALQEWVCESCKKTSDKKSLQREGFCADCNITRYVCLDCFTKKKDFVCVPCQKDDSLSLKDPIVCAACSFTLKRFYWRTKETKPPLNLCNCCASDKTNGYCEVVRNPPPPPPPPTPQPENKIAAAFDVSNLKITIGNDNIKEAKKKKSAGDATKVQLPDKTLAAKLDRIEMKLDRVLQYLGSEAKKDNDGGDGEYASDSEDSTDANRAVANKPVAKDVVNKPVAKDVDNLFGDEVDLQTETDYT